MSMILGFLVGLFVGTMIPETIKGLWDQLKQYFKQ